MTDLTLTQPNFCPAQLCVFASVATPEGEATVRVFAEDPHNPDCLDLDFEHPENDRAAELLGLSAAWRLEYHHGLFSLVEHTRDLIAAGVFSAASAGQSEDQTPYGWRDREPIRMSF